MGDHSQIQWTDATWNPVTGCSKVSPGCAHCYAERVAIRLWPSQYPKVERETIKRGAILSDITMEPRQFTDVQCHEDRLDQPLRWKKPRKVFVNSMSDLFHEDVPDAFIDRVFAVMALAPQHTFQILTKRAERMREYFSDHGEYAEQWYRRVFAVHRRMRDDGSYKLPPGYDQQYAIGRSVGCLTCGDHASRFLPNVWLGVSVENQRFADERIAELVNTPAAVRFLSCEPLLAPLDLRLDGHFTRSFIHWVIVGGESGAGARPFDVAWARAIVAECQAASVPVFVKQLGAVPVYRTGEPFNGAHSLYSNGEKLRDRKGGDMAEWPEDLRVREMPEPARA